MSAEQTITLSWPDPDIAVLTLDMPEKSANVLSSSVLDELSAHLDTLQPRDDLAGLILRSGKPNQFIAGADLRELSTTLDMPQEQTVELCRRGQQLFGRLAQCPFVTVAAIDGICVGGGAELAIWCDRRVLSNHPQTELGFPEVKLGIFPGWGGTARTPRMIGLSNAVEMITSGESIDAATAASLSLADDVVPAEQLMEAAVNLVRGEQVTQQYAIDRQQWSQPLTMSETELGFLGITASTLIRQKTKGHYPAPEAALELMLEAAAADLETACQLEAQAMAQLFGSPVNAALLNVFFLTDRNKKDRGVDRQVVQRQDIQSVGVIGAGIMGAGIAAVNIKRRLGVVLMDAAADALSQGVRQVMEEVAYDKKTKQLNAMRAVEFAPLLKVGTADQQLAQCDLVIEAIVESSDVKKRVFSRVEPLLAEDAILASNTSTIPITQLAAGLQHPHRFCGIHFFNPVRRMQLVEVIRGEQTSDETLAAAVAYAKKIGKMPIVVNDGPGFLVNRLLFPYMHEAIELLCEGASIQSIERAAKAFGMPMGPIELYDMVGLDTALFAGRTMWEAYPDRIVASPLLPAMVKAGRLGKKSGRGFYCYQSRQRKPQPDPELDALLEPYIRRPRQFTTDQLTARLFLPMLLEATRALQDQIVRDVRDVDLGLIFGLGFPPFRGGLLFWADTLGAKQILEMLAPLEALGERAKPTPLLLEMAQQGGRFYQ